MKHRSREYFEFITLFIVLAGVIIQSCKKSGTVSPAFLTEDSMSYDVNGKFVAIKCRMYSMLFHLSLNQYYYEIQGVHDTSASHFLQPVVSISLGTLTGGITSGTYSIGSSSYIFTDTVKHTSLYGLIIVNSYSYGITGSFSFTCTDSTKITNGYFFLVR